MKEDNRVNLIVELYKETREEMRHRRRIEWQTFAVVNVIYLGLLKVLYDYKGTLTQFQALMIIIAVAFFTWIWLIRIYGNARRYDFSSNMRNRIQDNLKRDPVIRTLIPPDCVAGGWRFWNKDWLFWSYRGICVAICLYFVAFFIGVWNKTDVALFSIDLKFQVLIFLILPAVLIYDIIMARGKLLFRVPVENYLCTLESRNIPDGLRLEFENNGIVLSYIPPRNITKKYRTKKYRKWSVTDPDNKRAYTIRKRGDKLNIYRARCKSSKRSWRRG